MITPCPEWENLISEYLDGELSEADRPRVEQHLFQCKSCGEYFQGAKADTATVAAAFAGLPRVCPKGFAARVMQRIRRPGTRRRKLGWVGIAVAASVLVALLVGRPASIGSVTRLIDGTGIAAAGGVELTQPEKPSTAVEQGTRVGRGDTIATGDDRIAFVDLKTSDTIVMNRNSRVVFLGSQSDARHILVVICGEVFVRASAGNGRFLVSTAAGRAEVIGTGFSVSYDPETSRAAVTVVEGTVRFHNASGAWLVAAGHQSVAAVDAAPTEPESVDARALTAWVDPPSPSRLAQVARNLTRNLRATVLPAKDVFEAGEPIQANMELRNIGREPVLFSRSIFVGREDNTARRDNYRLSQVMLTRIFGAELGSHTTRLPSDELAELKAGEVWQAKLNLTAPGKTPALRTLSGPGAYSVSVSFAAAARVPGAPGDSTVWADVASESAIIRVMSTAAAPAGRPVAGLQLDLASKSPGCRLGGELTLNFSLKGVTSDQIALSTDAAFQLKVEPTTFGTLDYNPTETEVYAKLAKTPADYGIDAKEMTLEQLARAMAERCGIDVLADRSLLKTQPMAVQPRENLGESLHRMAAAAGASVEFGRDALWLTATPKASVVSVGESLAKINGGGKGWITIKGGTRKDGELRLQTGKELFPKPGLYRCTVEYANRQPKTGPDWPAGWLGSVQSSSIVVAVFEPQPAKEREDNGLSMYIRSARFDAAKPRQATMEVELKNLSDEAIAFKTTEGLKVSDELMVNDILNPDCYDRADAELLHLLEKTAALREDSITVHEVLKRFSDDIGVFDFADLRNGELMILSTQTTLGELMEFIARLNQVSFVRSGGRQFVSESLSPVPEPAITAPAGISNAIVTIPARESKTFAITVQVAEAGLHRMQVHYLRTAPAPGEEKLWLGNLVSNAVTVEVE